jgi:hypothetical protein
MLLALLLAQLGTPSSMNLNGQAPTKFYCDGGIACSRTGSTLLIVGSGSGGGGTVINNYYTYDGGKVGEAYMADAAITAQYAQISGVSYSADAAYYAQTAGAAGTAFSADASVFAVFSETAGVAQTAYSADAAVYAATFDHDPAACTVGQYVTDISAAGALTCSTPSGGGGGGAGNFAEAQIVLTTSGYFSQTVAASWATASSRVICGVLGTDDAGLTAEVVALAGLGVTVNTLNPGVGFTVSVLNLAGLEGTVSIHCTGG